MKKIVFILLLIFSLSSNAQRLKDRIQGDWLCIKILDSKGNPAVGKYGESNEFLKFSFKKNSYAVTESPFDKGPEIPIDFRNENSFEWLPNAVYELPEKIYDVKELDEKQLILSTVNQNGVRINYFFINQNQFSENSNNEIIDNGIIIIKHIRLSKTNSKSINKSHEYQITNDSLSLLPSPTFESGGSFGQMFSNNINLPKTFKLDEISEELVLEFEVTENGAENFNISKGLSNDIDLEVIRVMNKLKDGWKQVIINKLPQKSKIRFHIYFFMKIKELNLRK